MKKFLLMVPRSISPKNVIPRIHMPLGALAIASQAKQEGFNVRLLDTSIGNVNENNRNTYFERMTETVIYDGIEYWRTGLSDTEILNRIRGFDPDVIAISCCTVVDREDTKYLCSLVKHNFPQIPIFLGGHEISHNYEQVLVKHIERNYIPDIEGISLGLGQPNIASILNYVLAPDKSELAIPPGYATVINGKVIASNPDDMDPNMYSLFDYSLLEKVYISGRKKPYDVYSFIGNTHAGNIGELLHKKTPVSYFPIFTSYGCGNNCTFCDTDQYLLRYSLDNVISMIEQYDNLFGIDYIDFMDNNFAGGNIKSREICFQILDYISKKHYKIGFSNGLTFESMMRNDFELLKKFKDTGNVVHIAFPCENGNDRVLKMIRKPHTLKMILDTLTFVQSNLPYINREAFFIGGFPETLGQPAEKPEEIETTVCFIDKLIKSKLIDQAIFLKLSPVTSMYRTMWEEKHPDKSFVHCLFSRGTNIWPYDNELLEQARVAVEVINENAHRFVTRKL